MSFVEKRQKGLTRRDFIKNTVKYHKNMLRVITPLVLYRLLGFLRRLQVFSSWLGVLRAKSVVVIGLA